MRGLYSHSREYRKIFLRNDCPDILQLLGGNSYRCEYMLRLEYRKNSRRIIYVLVSYQALGVFVCLCRY